MPSNAARAVTIGRMPRRRSSIPRLLAGALLAASFHAAFAAEAPPEQRRCGWLATHGGDAVLSDRDGDWLLARAGTHRARGDWSPAFGAGQSVAAADGGVGCACLAAQADPTNHRIVAAHSPQPRPLAACRGDKALETPAALQRASQAAKTVRGAGFSIDVPANWRVRVKNGCVGMTAPGQRMKRDEDTLQVCGKPGTLAQAADSQIISPGEDGVWTRTAGMSMPSPVAWMFGPGWEGVTAVQSCGIEDELGFHGAGGECLVFAASDGRQSATAETDGRWTEFDKADAILRTLRFDGAAAVAK